MKTKTMLGTMLLLGCAVLTWIMGAYAFLFLRAAPLGGWSVADLLLLAPLLSWSLPVIAMHEFDRNPVATAFQLAIAPIVVLFGAFAVCILSSTVRDWHWLNDGVALLFWSCMLNIPLARFTYGEMASARKKSALRRA